MPKKVVIIICAILIASTATAIGIMYRSDDEEAIIATNTFNKVVQNNERTTVHTTKTDIVEDPPDDVEIVLPGQPAPTDPSKPAPTPEHPSPTEPSTEPSSESPPVIGQPFSEDWLKCVILAHRMFGHSGYKYLLGGHEMLNGLDVRVDCSGYVSYAMYLYGINKTAKMYTSKTMYTSPFLQRVNVNVYSDLQIGDILVYDGHVEVFAEYRGKNKPYVYNWGGPKSAEKQYIADNYTSHDILDCTLDPRHSSSHYLSEIMYVLRVPPK